MNRILLYLVMLPAPLWARLGADTLQLRALLDARLRLDDRRPVNGITRPGAQTKKRRFSILLSMVVSVFSGMIYTFALAMNDDRSGLFFYFGIFLLMLSFMLISDFSNVLVDTRDKYIVLPAPVSGRTLFLARMLHIGAYLLRIVLPMAVPGMIVLATQHGWAAALWFLLPVLLLAATALFLVLGCYLLILRVASQSRFKEILTYFQIGFSIVVFGGYYLFPRFIDKSNFLNFSIDRLDWAKYTPPYWLMSLYSWAHPLGSGLFVWGILAIVFPLLCMYLSVRVLAPRFAGILGALDVTEAGDTVPTGGTVKRPSKGLASRIARLLNRDRESLAGFTLVWLQTARSRSFKMKVYPAIATTPIMLLAPFLVRGRGLGGIIENLQDTRMHIFLLYISTLFLVQILSALQVSEQYKASWIYRASPMQRPGALIAAGYKVILVRFVVPFYVLISAVVLYIWGIAAVADILLAFANVTLYGWCMMRLSFRRLPFSELAEDTGGGSRFLLGLLGFFIGGLLGLAHYLTFDFLILKILFFVLSAIATWLVADSVRNTSWETLRTKEQ